MILTTFIVETLKEYFLSYKDEHAFYFCMGIFSLFVGKLVDRNVIVFSFDIFCITDLLVN